MAFSKPAPAVSKDSTPSYYLPKLSTPSPFICVGGALRESGASLSMPSRTAARACALCWSLPMATVNFSHIHLFLYFLMLIYELLTAAGSGDAMLIVRRLSSHR